MKIKIDDSFSVSIFSIHFLLQQKNPLIFKPFELVDKSHGIIIKYHGLKDEKGVKVICEGQCELCPISKSSQNVYTHEIAVIPSAIIDVRTKYALISFTKRYEIPLIKFLIDHPHIGEHSETNTIIIKKQNDEIELTFGNTTDVAYIPNPKYHSRFINFISDTYRLKDSIISAMNLSDDDMTRLYIKRKA